VEQRIDRPVLINAMIGLFLGGLSARIFLISLPTVAGALGTDMLGVSWALIAYQVAGIGLGVVIGKLGDIYSRRRIYRFGLIFMTAGSFLCGISQNVLQLALFRFLQGIAGSIIQSSGRALGLAAMPKGSEGKAQGLMVMAQQLGFLLGPPVGGFIIELFGWRWVFFLVVPIGAAGILLTYAGGTETNGHSPHRRQPLDYKGAVSFFLLAVLATLLLDQKTAELYGVESKGVLFLVFAAALWHFLRHESRTTNPMLDLGIFNNRVFGFGAAGLLAVCIAQSLTNFIMPFYLQEVLAFSPSFMGLLFLIPSLFNLILAPASGHMADKIGARVPLIAGVSFFIAAFTIGANFGIESYWLVPAALLALFGIGMALFNAPVQAAMVGTLPQERWGVATGIIHAIFGLGHLLGIALTGVVLTIAFRHYSGVANAVPDPGLPIAFVASINAAFIAAMAIGLFAVYASTYCRTPIHKPAKPESK
jgi:EmrB/QacA subfamily drug resistance transporter